MKRFITVFATIAIAISVNAQEINIDQSIIEHDKANVAMMKKDLVAAYGHLKKAIAFDPSNSVFINSTAYMAMQNGEPEKAIEYLDMALVLDKEKFGDVHPNVASVINNKASVYSSMDNHKMAVEHYQQAYDMVAAALGETHPQVTVIKGLLDAEKAK
jgi:tetratricopeptide (TPR) repeat protein